MSSWGGRQFYTLTARERPTVGDTKFSAVNLDHMGWLVCNGRNVAIKDYYFLFQVVGYSFGSNTSNDFNLPNMAGRVPGAIGSGVDLTTRALGSNVGEETHTLTVAEMPTHNHTGTTDISGAHIHTHNANGASPGYGLIYRNGNTTLNSATDNSPLEPNLGATPAALVLDSAGAHTHTFATSNTGLSNTHNNMQPTTFIGNMFIYSGLTNYASFNFPYKPRTNLY